MEFLIEIEFKRVIAETEFVLLFLNIYILYYKLFYSEILFFISYSVRTLKLQDS